jgi:hypothetical protein
MEVSVWTIQACISDMFSNRQTITCANLLSNTAQALTSYVEALQDASNATDPLPFLEEALELFQKCLEYQELQHREFREQASAAAVQETDTDDGGVSLTTGSTMNVDSEPGMYIVLIWVSQGHWNIYHTSFLNVLSVVIHSTRTDLTLYSYSIDESCPTT